MVGKPEGQKDKDRLVRVGIHKVEMGLEETGWLGGCGLDPSGSERCLVSGCGEHGDELSGSIKCGKFLTTELAPWSWLVGWLIR